MSLTRLYMRMGSIHHPPHNVFGWQLLSMVLRLGCFCCCGWLPRLRDGEVPLQSVGACTPPPTPISLYRRCYNYVLSNKPQLDHPWSTATGSPHTFRILFINFLFIYLFCKHKTRKQQNKQTHPSPLQHKV